MSVQAAALTGMIKGLVLGKILGLEIVSSSIITLTFIVLAILEISSN